MNKLITLTSILIALASHGVLGADSPDTTVIYSQDFTPTENPRDLNHRRPTKGNGGWVSNYSGIMNDGLAKFGYCYLPFTPVAGKIYTLSVDMVATGADGSWSAMGFQTGGSETAFNTSGAGWQLVNPGGMMELRSEGKAIANGTQIGDAPIVDPDSTNTFTIELNTAGDKWVETFRLDNVVMKTHTYTTNPDIQFVGLMSFSQPDKKPGKFSGTFSLTEKPAGKPGTEKPAEKTGGAQ
ncbi:MAG: hypothetical protein WCH98_03090 [Verrucomicrobiota bacterium]